ncbi:MAG: hypothetical protein IJ593_05045 [Lachnospiraceae bacterium]|nr:hypothetical protein [Lachnospiraceae bacterium]
MLENVANMQEYENLRNEYREQLEARYNFYMGSGDTESAHSVLKELMKYSLIDKNDKRTLNKTKLFGNIDCDNPSNWGRYDYRRYRSSNINDCLGAWIYTDLKAGCTLSIDTIEHWGKRVEGNFEGDILITGFKHKINIKLAENGMLASYSADNIAKTFAMNNQTFGEYNKLKELLYNGLARVYSVDFGTDVLNNNKHIGDIVVVPDADENIQVYAVLRNSAIVNSWIDLRDTVNKISLAVAKLVEDVDNYYTVFSVTNDADAQQMAIKNNLETGSKQFRTASDNTERIKAEKIAKKEEKLKELNEKRKTKKLVDKLEQETA